MSPRRFPPVLLTLTGSALAEDGPEETPVQTPEHVTGVDVGLTQLRGCLGFDASGFDDDTTLAAGAAPCTGLFEG